MSLFLLFRLLQRTVTGSSRIQIRQYRLELFSSYLQTMSSLDVLGGGSQARQLTGDRQNNHAAHIGYQ